MFICNECGKLTEELGTIQEPIPYGERTEYKEYTDWDCSCGGEFEKANTCKQCGEFFGNSFEGDFCPECAKETVEMFEDFMDKFTPDQRAYLNEYYEGREF